MTQKVGFKKVLMRLPFFEAYIYSFRFVSVSFLLFRSFTLPTFVQKKLYNVIHVISFPHFNTNRIQISVSGYA